MTNLRHIALLLTVLCAPALAQPKPGPAAPAAGPGFSTTAQLDPESQKLLSNERWRDPAYGISILPPLGTVTIKQTADDALLRIIDDAHTYAISVAVKRTRNPMSVKDATALAMENITGAAGITRPLFLNDDPKAPLDTRPDTFGNRPAALFYVRVPIDNQKEAMLGQAVIQLDKQLFVFIDVRCELEKRPQVRPIFEAVLKSFQLTDVIELNKARETALANGRKWRESVTIKQLRAAIIPEQFFRLLEGGKDFGYMKVTQMAVTKDAKPGLGVEVQSHFAIGDAKVDSLAEYFLADDDATELWTVKTTQRQGNAPKQPAKPAAKDAKDAPAQPQGITYVETGVRVGKKITITIDSPEGRSKKEFEKPETGYISQVESWLLPATLPIDHPGTYGYYCYHSNLGKLLLRTDAIVPVLTGYSLTTTLSPNEDPITSQYNSKRQLLEKHLGPGRLMLPSSAAEIQKLWRTR